MIVIIDYGMGNLRSVSNAFAHIGVESCITDDIATILEADKIIIPGVGSFGQAMENIRSKGLDKTIKHFFESGKPILGICLGMQILLDWGMEGGRTVGLGLIPGHVEELKRKKGVKLPHIGFNEAVFDVDNQASKLFMNVKSGTKFYFVHSFQVICDDDKHISAETIHGNKFISAIRRDHVYGVQFHPEKSRDKGLTILKNFATCNHQN